MDDVLNIAAAVARGYARRYRWADPADLAQEACAAVLASGRTFQPERGVPATAYARAAARRALWGYVNQMRAPVSNRHRPGDLASIPVASDVETASLPPVDGPAIVEAAELRRRVRDLLAPEEWDVLVAGDTPARVADRLGVPVARVYAALRAARARLKNDPVLRTYAQTA